MDWIAQLADTAVKTEAALGELHHYHRFGRHLSLFPQKPYFLFSHCAHLLFSLWLAEQDSRVKVFAASPSLAALLESVDFGSLRYTDYSRRMLYANAYEEHLKNEPKWFKFWVRLLQELEHSEAQGLENFATKFIACLGDCGLFEGRLARRDQKVLAGFVQGPRMGRLLLHSIWVLEDVIFTAGTHIAGFEPAARAVEQMQLMICLFNQMRRAIVWETAVRGPYTPASRCAWSTASTLERLFGGKIPGLLTITPTPEGGQVTCTHACQADSKPCERTWVQSIAALPCGYEELLFKTWPQEMPTQLPDRETPVQGQAHWMVYAVEASHLETIARHVDRLLEGFGRCPVYDSFVETVAGVLRNGQNEWTATELPWDYIRTLDQLIAKLKFACREAKVLGGDNPTVKVVANLWPPQGQPSEATDATISDKPVVEESSAPEPQTHAEPQLVEISDKGDGEQVTQLQALPGHVELPSPASEPSAADHPCEAHEPQADSSDKPELVDIEALMQPACYAPQNHVDQPPVQAESNRVPQNTDRLMQLIGLLLADEDSPPQSAAPTTRGKPDDREAPSARQSLVWRLLEWHRPPAEGDDLEPLSLVQLQQDLGWNQPEVLQAMSDLFGSKPFTIYRQKCLEKSIRRYLEDCGGIRTRVSETRAPNTA